MTNPFSIAVKGKGFLPMLARARAITSRYGFTPEKMDSALAQLVGSLKKFGCQATIPVTALALARHPELAYKYYASGLELAVHGLAHLDYRQLSLEHQLNSLHRAQDIFKRAGLHPTGFRSPYLHWNADTMTVLKECGFAYDSSQALDCGVTDGLKTDAYRRVLDFYGALSASNYPALPRLEAGIVRIPYCLPDDEALVERLQLTCSRAMAEHWLAVLDRAYETGELFTLGLHPERVPLCQEALEAVLRRARSLSPPVWIAKLDEIVTWYKSLGQLTFATRQETADWFHIWIQAPPGATILVRSLEMDAPARAWANGYRTISVNEFSIRSTKRPFIGLSPDCPPSLKTFLHHLGYLVEINVDAQEYSYYLRRVSFSPDDESSLLMEMDKGDWPIVRIARWPWEAQCALAVTGDIDALTIWDYGQRMWNA